MSRELLLLLCLFLTALGSHIPLGHLNLTSLTVSCQRDMSTWIKVMAELDLEFLECFEEKSRVCTNTTRDRIKENAYALKQLDAWGKLRPGLLDGSFTSYGSPSECKEVDMRLNYSTKYCYVESDIFNGDKSTEAKYLPPYKLAVCVPRSCNDQDLLLISNQLPISFLRFDKVSCVPTSPEFPSFFWVFLPFLFSLIFLCLASSALDYYNWNYFERPPRLSKPLRLLLSFSIYTNGAAILETKAQPEGHLKCLDCIRLFSMVWVVSGHMTVLWLRNDSLQILTTLTHPVLSETFTNAFFSVDTFFVLSGLLVSYMFFKMVLKKPQLVKSSLTWVMFYVHRLTPPYILFICFFMAITPLLHGVNSIDFNYKSFVSTCDTYWWRNLIYINNLNHKESCYQSTWYLAADTQMYIFSPVILLGLFYNHFLGILLILVTMTVSITLTFLTIYHYNLPATFSHLENADLYVEHLYTKPWIRITPYLLGLYLGYVIAKYGKNRRPKISRIVVIGGWVLFGAMGLACVYGPYKYMDFQTDWSKFWRSFYYSFSRIGWGLFICWVVLANYWKWGGPIASFMEHPIWQPFGRLSYSAYLVHLFVIMYFVNLSDRPVHFTGITEQFLYYVIPITTLSYVLGFFWSCLCEIPFLKMEKLLIETIVGGGRSEKTEEK